MSKEIAAAPVEGIEYNYENIIALSRRISAMPLEDRKFS